MRAGRALAFAGWALALSLPLAAWAHFAWGSAGLGLLLLPVLAGIVGWFRALPSAQVARFADASAGLNAAADTAIYLSNQGHPAAMAVALDALDGLQGAKPPPLRPPASWRWVIAGLVAAIALAVVLPTLDEPAPPPPDAHAEARARLDDLEAKARRQGQEQLVAAVRALRMRLEDAWEQEAEAEAKTPPPAPKPIAPPPPKESPSTPPPDGLSPEEWTAAMESAQLRMSDDKQALNELSKLLEEQLVQITAFQKSADSLLYETMALNGMDNPFSDFQSQSSMMSAQQAQRGINQNNEFMERGVAQAVDISNPAGMQRNDMDKASHERTHALQQSYHDFLKAYAESMREELLNAMKDVTEKQQEGGSSGGSEGMDLSSNFAQAGKKSAGESQQPTNLAEREGGAEQATATLAKLGEKGHPTKSGMSGAGSGESTEAGGKGAGTGASGEGEQVGAPEAAAGDTEQLTGQFNPGTLDRDEQIAALSRVSELAAATGSGSEFDDAWNGYFDEVERTLVEEDLPPMMEGMVRAYFAGLREER